MCSSPSISTPEAPKIEPVKQPNMDADAGRDNTMRRLLRRYSLFRTNVTGGGVQTGSTTTRKTLLGE